MSRPNGSLPAMPIYLTEAMINAAENGADEVVNRVSGLTKREMFAMHFAGHIWAQYQNDGTSVQYDNWREGVCVESIRLADQLLAELEETK